MEIMVKKGEWWSRKMMRRTPKGHFVVYVGEEMKRFVVPTLYLKDAGFQKLLEQAAEEFGFHSPKGIVLPCHESVFLTVVLPLHHKTTLYTT
nr:Auxin-induced protein X15 [Ipomoea batatas]